jgi:hypothetical protein
MAYALPGSEFVGIDRSGQAVARGLKTIATCHTCWKLGTKLLPDTIRQILK